MPHFNQRLSIPAPTTAFKYTVVPDDATKQALTAVELRTALKIDIDTLSDVDANNLILDAQAWAENYAGFILFKSAITTFRNEFPYLGFELRRYPVMPSEIITVEHLVDAVLVTVASTVYILAERSFYSVLFLKDGQDWPATSDVQADNIKITFFAGYGADATFLPRNIIAGIKALAVYLYENPGDCDSCAAGEMAFPGTAGKLLRFHKPLKV